MKLKVKVVPNAARTEAVSWLGDHLKVRIAAAPQDGKANAELIAYLAGELGLSKSRVRIAAGHGTPRKLLVLDGVDAAYLESRLGVGSGNRAASRDRSRRQS